jgi:fatty acid desaturase
MEATTSDAAGSLCSKFNFRPAVTGGPDRLSPLARAEIQGLSGHRPLRFLIELAITWAVIAAAIVIGVWADSIVVTILCIVVIGVRQMVLGLLLHEQVHRLGLRGQYGDWIVNALAVYPLFATTVEDYAKVHLSHHKYFMTPKDPDFMRKAGPQWTFPMPLRDFLRIVLRDVTGLNTIALIKGKTGKPGQEEFNRPNPTPTWFRLAYFALAAIVLTLVGGWTVFFVYWVIPVLTVFQLLIRWTAVMEHQYNIENSDVSQVTPLIRLKWWQKVLTPDLNFAQHAYHHYHPGVSFSKLPHVHEIYRREGLVDDTAIFDGQGAFLRFLIAR